MAKSLSERIAERAKHKRPSRAGKNRAAFLAVRDDIKKSLEDGWSMKEVWETLYEEKALPFRYDAFIGYVNKLIRRPPPSQKGPIPGREQTGHAPGPSPESVESTKSPDTAVTPEQPPVLKKVEPDKFVFDSKPNAKELI